MTQAAPFYRSSRKLTRDRITFSGLNDSLTLGLGGLRLLGVNESGISNSFPLEVSINKQSLIITVSVRRISLSLSSSNNERDNSLVLSNIVVIVLSKSVLKNKDSIDHRFRLWILLLNDIADYL
jgi:hypothetical protein